MKKLLPILFSIQIIGLAIFMVFMYRSHQMLAREVLTAPNEAQLYLLGKGIMYNECNRQENPEICKCTVDTLLKEYKPSEILHMAQTYRDTLLVPHELGVAHAYCLNWAPLPSGYYGPPAPRGYLERVDI